MRPLTFSSITAVTPLVVFISIMLWPQMLWADSLRLMTDLEYRVNNNSITDKSTSETREVKNKTFLQRYNLDLQKELFPNLSLTGGGSFDDNKVDTDVDGDSTDRRENAIRPYVDLHLNSQLLKATTGYHKSEIKLSGSEFETSRRFTEEYLGSLGWKPVELPEVDFYFSHNLRYNDPNSTEEKIDKESDTYQLKTKYDYQKYQFDYTHTTSEDRDLVTDYETTSNTDIGIIRYNDSFQEGKFSLSGGLRLKRDEVEFRGGGDRRVPTTSTGRSFANTDDPPPATSNIQGDFDENLSDKYVNLLRDGAPQLSFGLDFGLAEDLDTIYVQLIPETSLNNQATASEVNAIKDLYSWSVYVSDDQLNWTIRPITQIFFDVFENRFEISFASAKTTFIKIAVTPLPTILLPGKEIRLANLRSFRTLPPDTSTFRRTDWKTDFSLNWKVSDKTTSGYDFLYREETSDPFDDKRTLMSNGVRLTHQFNHIYTGNTRLLRTDVTERGEGDRTGHTFSSSLAANYLDTFSQTLTYSFAHQDDEDEGIGTTNALSLRNNLAMYDGWGMTLDTGHTWQSPADGESSDRTFIRIDNSIIPNRWMNFTLFYEINWTNTDGREQQQEETGRLIASWVPLASLSLNADVLINDKSGEDDSSSTVQNYFVNWSPFRDGTLQISLSYSILDDSEGDDTWAFSPRASWQVNKKTMLTCDYSVGERDGERERNEFDTARITLRFFY